MLKLSSLCNFEDTGPGRPPQDLMNLLSPTVAEAAASLQGHTKVSCLYPEGEGLSVTAGSVGPLTQQNQSLGGAGGRPVSTLMASLSL